MLLMLLMLAPVGFRGWLLTIIGCWRASEEVKHTFHVSGPPLPCRPDTPQQEGDENNHDSSSGVPLPLALGIDQRYKDESDEE